MIGKPEKGRMVENMLLRMAQSGQIVNKLGEDELIGLLEQVNSQMQSQERKTTVKVINRLDIVPLAFCNITFLFDYTVLVNNVILVFILFLF